MPLILILAEKSQVQGISDYLGLDPPWLLSTNPNREDYFISCKTPELS